MTESPKPEGETIAELTAKYRALRERRPVLNAREPDNGPGMSVAQFVELLKTPVHPEAEKALPKLKL